MSSAPAGPSMKDSSGSSTLGATQKVVKSVFSRGSSIGHTCYEPVLIDGRVLGPPSPARCKREAIAECREPSHFLKRKAMTKTVREFYRGAAGRRRPKPRGRSWKNIVSIGDSLAERLALQDRARQSPVDLRVGPLRAPTVLRVCRMN